MGSDELAQGIAFRNGKIALAGYRFNGSNDDWLVMKCNEQGETLWTRIFDTGINEYAIDASFDDESNIITTGYIFSYKNGSKLKFPLSKCQARVNPKFFPGVNFDQEVSALTISYDSVGEIKWQRTESNKEGIGIVTDNAGNCYVSGAFFTGYGYDFWLVKYNQNGETLWSRTYDFTIYDIGYRSAIDREGNVVMTGFLGNGYSFDCILLKFNPQGDTIFSRFFDLSLFDYGVGIATDQANNIIIGGFTGDTLNTDYLILKYDSNGNLLWSRTYSQAKNEGTLGVACDVNNNIFVTGVSGEMYYDYLTIKYDPAGNVLWTTIYDNGSDDEGADVACDENGNPIVTGASFGTANYDFLTIKYRGEVGIEETRRTANSQLLPRSIITGSNLVFYPPFSGHFKLELYNVSGKRERLIHSGYLNQGEYKYSLNGLNSSLHFLKISSQGGKSVVQKLILIK